MVKRRKVADAQHAVGGQRLKVQLDLGEEPEGPFGADQQMSHVVAAGGGVRARGDEVEAVTGPGWSCRDPARLHGDVQVCYVGAAARPVRPRGSAPRIGCRARREGVDVVAADPSEQRREASRDLVGLAGAESAHAPDQIEVAAVACAVRDTGEVARRLAEPDRAPVGEDRVDGVHVVHHVAVADGARAAGVVAGHAADRGPVGRGHVHGEEEPLRCEPGVEAVEYEAGAVP